MDLAVQSKYTANSAALAKNPYNDVLSYKSVQEGQFFKDSSGNIANKYQKPLSLYFQLLTMFALPDSVVLDATCGTGSLELAAMEPGAPTGLSFVSFEKNQYQADHCQRRIERSCTRPTSEDQLMVDMISEGQKGNS
jgi:DNA modification methylase